MQSITDTFTLNDKNLIPCLGYGTWKTPNDKTAVESVKEALKIGYRHIDAAAIYKNELQVGQGIKESNIDRKSLWITSKVWNAERGYESTIKACQKTLDDLKLDYLDMYLIHWPASKKQFPQDWKKINQETWRALEMLQADGKVKTIGVCNCFPMHLDAILETAKVKPAINQIEFHPGYTQDEVVTYCKKNDIQVEAWSPLGSKTALANPIIVKVAKETGRTEAQVVLRWCLQQNILPLSKSLNPSRILSNTQLFDFKLSQSDMDLISSIKECGFSGHNPETIEF